MSASVPGCIQRDLMTAGLLPDLQTEPEPASLAAWVDESDWWYRCPVPAIADDERAWIRFDGIDYLAAVTVNGEELGRGAGMFAPRQWEISRWLRSGPGQLGVRVWGGGALPTWPASRWRRFLRRHLGRFQGGLPPFDDRLLTLKAPMHFGWDFSPRLLVTGIWDEVTLHTARHVGLLDVWARADWGEDAGMVVQMTLDADTARQIEVELSLRAMNFKGQAVQRRQWSRGVQAGSQRLALYWPHVDMRPWHTHDRGFPHLYHLHVRLLCDGEVCDEHTVTVGARQMGWGRRSPRTPPAPPFYLNGERLPLRGINWVPLDLLPGAADVPQRYRHLLQSAVDAGVNAIRVWGGGGRERGLFYDLCDELGLLVWQEMPIACVFFDALPDDEGFVALVDRETRGIIRTLRQHPSLMMWGGGNEWGPGRHRGVAAAMSAAAAEEDTGRRWIPASPGPGDSHNWQVWHEKAPPIRYTQDPAPLLSEYGHAAPPSPEVLAALLPERDRWPPGPGWSQRKAELGKLWHYASAFLGADDVTQVGLDEFVQACQQSQARTLQVGMEAYRLRSDAVGSFIWQWNESWPAICWSIWPHRGAAKLAYEQIRRSYAPVALLARLQDQQAEIWLLNDTLHELGPCHLDVRVDDQVRWQADVTPAPGRQLLTRIDLPAHGRYLRLHLRGHDLDYENDYDLRWWWAQDSARPGLGTRLRQRLKAYLLRW